MLVTSLLAGIDRPSWVMTNVVLLIVCLLATLRRIHNYIFGGMPSRIAASVESGRS
jgi:hypothetical protein